jgi:enamine deaminase RidA (YjgF/YER057c/UK114 family)
MTTSITLLRPSGLVQSPAFSHVAVIPPGATQIHVGGQNAVDTEGRLVGGDDAVAQVEQTMANLRTALAAADATMEDLVSLTVLLAEGVDLQAGYRAAARNLPVGDRAPLVTAAIVRGLGVPGALVEVSAVAAVVR